MIVRGYINRVEGEIPGIYTFDDVSYFDGKIKLVRECYDSYYAIISTTVVDSYKAENILHNLFGDGKYDFTRDGIEFEDEPDEDEPDEDEAEVEEA